MKQILIKKDGVVVEDIPAPQVEDGKVLVKVINSCLSIGTDMTAVQMKSMPIWKRALKEPDKVKKVLQMTLEQGFSKTREAVKGKLDTGVLAGYSASGIVVAVGKGITDIKAGERVACAGAQFAYHAEIINVTRNLVVKIPDTVTMPEASVVTLGSIAMQGVRRANTTLGETFVVIGLGAVGQLTVQLLKASGCKVIVSDLDTRRIDMALAHGADSALIKDGQANIEEVARLTGGIGADGVIITAATKSDVVVSTAFQMCRRKGRVVLVGDVGLNLNRDDFYAKEIDFFISTSYGPGRYDHIYEERGLEYPVSYVRWTEGRNLQEVLYLMSVNKLSVKDMISAVYSIDQAPEAYESLKSGVNKPLLVILEYPERSEKLNNTVLLNGRQAKLGKINLALVGAGSFAKGMHLPNIKQLDSLYQLHTVMSRTGTNAKAVAQQFGAVKATTSFDSVIQDSEIDAILIATRHNLHAATVLQALKAGKHVLVEKPLAINEQELIEIRQFFENTPQAPMLLTGFNRRHSRYMKEIAKHTSKRNNPLIIHYTMNAGYIPLDHWVHTEEGAGRNIGEACHIYDVFNYLTGAKVTSVKATSITPNNDYYSSRDNFAVLISYDDGSIANLLYLANGSKDYPKETMDVFFDGKMIRLDDYKSMQGHGLTLANITTNVSEKGQKEELESFGKAIMSGAESPIPFWQQVQTMEIAFEVEKQL